MSSTTKEIMKAYQELNEEQKRAVIKIAEVFLEMNKETQKKA